MVPCPSAEPDAMDTTSSCFASSFACNAAVLRTDQKVSTHKIVMREKMGKIVRSLKCVEDALRTTVEMTMVNKSEKAGVRAAAVTIPTAMSARTDINNMRERMSLLYSAIKM